MTEFRDGMRWIDAEHKPGQYEFRLPTTRYPERIQRQGGHLTVTLNWGNPLYDSGRTPHSPEAVAAFGRFAAELVTRFPAIKTVEIGNEFNSANFVSGPVKDAGITERWRYHLAMLRSAHRAVKAVRPAVDVLGGATHSIPVGYLRQVLDGGGGEVMDGLAIHPYTTPTDQLARQIGVLRRLPGAARMPIAVTEFGSDDPDHAADDMIRAYATMASLGFEAAYWYPLNERRDGMVPLVRRNGALTNAGRAFRFLKTHFAGLSSHDVSPDAFTFAHAFSADKFGKRALVIWGAPRNLTIGRPDIKVYDATGEAHADGALQLQDDRALILISDTPFALGQDVKLGCTALIADSFYQFAYPKPGELRARGDRFERFIVKKSAETPFKTLPGQQRRSVPWTPYLGLDRSPTLRLTATSLVPAGRGNNQQAIAHRFVASTDQTLALNARFRVAKASRDGVTVRADLNGQQIFEAAGRGLIEIDRPGLTLKQGDRITIIVAPNDNAKGDRVNYRIRLTDPQSCPGRDLSQFDLRADDTQ